ncbi:hypothetical protein GGF32_006574 [Allomyces javanicus]|nr:hypothetical protein GGF32_006574 [Allomyces javanicus]
MYTWIQLNQFHRRILRQTLRHVPDTDDAENEAVPLVNTATAASKARKKEQKDKTLRNRLALKNFLHPGVQEVILKTGIGWLKENRKLVSVEITALAKDQLKPCEQDLGGKRSVEEITHRTLQKTIKDWWESFIAVVHQQVAKLAPTSGRNDSLSRVEFLALESEGKIKECEAKLVPAKDPMKGACGCGSRGS